jgi:hypothetical protein
MAIYVLGGNADDEAIHCLLVTGLLRFALQMNIRTK